MATITLKGNPIHTAGELPGKGSAAPDFSLLRGDLSRATLASFSGKKILNIFPSIDTPVCATSVRKFNQIASDKGVTVLNISEDLPFAQKRFCGAEGIEKCESLSAFRSSFGKDWGLEIADGPLAGLTARAVVVLDESNKVVHAELVPEIAQEPNYEAALAAVG
jgi:thiol peroxidase